jgi:hypothetical protein
MMRWTAIALLPAEQRSAVHPGILLSIRRTDAVFAPGDMQKEKSP